MFLLDHICVNHNIQATIKVMTIYYNMLDKYVNSTYIHTFSMVSLSLSSVPTPNVWVGLEMCSGCRFPHRIYPLFLAHPWTHRFKESSRQDIPPSLSLALKYT